MRSPTLTIHAALIEIRDLSIGDSAARKEKFKALRADPERQRLLAQLSGQQPTFKSLLQASRRLAAA